MCTPSLGKTLNAEVCSSGVTSTAPSATGKYGGILEVMPKRRAYSMTVLIPTLSASFSAGMLRDCASARRSVIVPSNFSS